MYPEKKRPQPKDRKIALVADNKMSKVWAFLFQNLAKWDERNIDQPKFMTTAQFYLRTVIMNPHYQILISRAVIVQNNAFSDHFYNHNTVDYIS